VLEQLDLVLELALHELVAHVPEGPLLVHPTLELENYLAGLLRSDNEVAVF
jgi:hypothetical protein